MLFALQFDKVIDYKTIGSTRDKDVFDRAKIEVQKHLSRNELIKLAKNNGYENEQF